MLQRIATNRAVLMTLWRRYRKSRRYLQIREDTHLNRQQPLTRISATFFCAYYDSYGLHWGVRDTAIAAYEEFRQVRALPEFMHEQHRK